MRPAASRNGWTRLPLAMFNATVIGTVPRRRRRRRAFDADEDGDLDLSVGSPAGDRLFEMKAAGAGAMPRNRNRCGKREERRRRGDYDNDWPDRPVRACAVEEAPPPTN